MRDEQREVLAVLKEVVDLSPDVRLGQLLSHIAFLAEVHVGKSLADIEDDEFLAVLYRHQAELQARAQGATTKIPPTDASTSVSGSPSVPDTTSGG